MRFYFRGKIHNAEPISYHSRGVCTLGYQLIKFNNFNSNKYLEKQKKKKQFNRSNLLR